MLLVHYLLPNGLNGYHQSGRTLESFMLEEMSYRHNDPVFSRRLLTSFLIDQLHFGLKMSYWRSFLIVNFGLFAVFGFLLAKIALGFQQTIREIIASLIVFFTGFSVIFAFCSPIYSYDEPLQYCFLALTIIGIQQKNDFLILLGLVASFFARESSVLLFPSFYFIIVSMKNNEKNEKSNLENAKNNEKHLDFIKKLINWRYIFLFLIPTILYLLFYYKFYGKMAGDTGRWIAWKGNFRNLTYTLESIFSCLLVLLLPCVMVFKNWKKNIDAQKKMWILGFFLALFCNTIIVFIATTAREARLFALPLLLVFGFSGGLYRISIKKMYDDNLVFFENNNTKNRIKLLVNIILSLIIAYILGFICYHSTDSANCEKYYQFYLFTNLFFVFYVNIDYENNQYQSAIFKKIK